LTELALAASAVCVEPSGASEGGELPEDVAVHEPHKFRFRGTGFGFGALGGISPAGPDFEVPVHGWGSALVSWDVELGSRRARIVSGFNLTSGFFYDICGPTVEGCDIVGLYVFGLTAGGLFGNEKFRVGPVGLLGWVAVGAELRFLMTPWRTRRGGRHGLEVRAGWMGPYVSTLTIAYRISPARLNRVRSRRR
jgi:hypothetical protein